MNTSEERISESKDRLIGISKTSMHREDWINKTEWNIQELWSNLGICKTFLIGIPAREERENRTETIFEIIMAENIPMNYTKLQI